MAETPPMDSHNNSNSISSSETNPGQQQGYPSFSKLLQGVVLAAANSAASTNPLVKDANFQFEISQREALASVSAKAAESQMQQSEVKPKSENSPNELPPSKDLESSVPSPREEKPSIQHKENVKEVDDQKSPCLALIPLKPADSPPAPKPVSMLPTKEKVDKLNVKRGNSFHNNERADDIPRTPNSDGYGWRKYGQKQVKNSGSSRSYYRCTFFNCIAKKKVQHLDVSGEIIAVVYKGEHNHEPPQHLKGSTRKRDAPSADAPVNEKQLGDTQTPTSATCRKEVEYAIAPMVLDNGDRKPSTPASLQEKAAGQESATTPVPTKRVPSEEATFSTEAEQCKSSNKSSECGMKEFEVIPLKKRRIKECGKSIPESVYRTFKEPKVIVHTSGDVGSSNDGYRWRKYGQKMVKGNPNPRSYYRCSSPGCPVRKHVERSTDNSTAIIVTYEGIHDHDKPVPNKVQGHHSSSPRSPPQITEKSGPKSPPRSQGPPSGPQSKDVESGPKGEDSDEKKPGTGEAGSSDKVLGSPGIELKSC